MSLFTIDAVVAGSQVELDAVVSGSATALQAVITGPVVSQAYIETLGVGVPNARVSQAYIETLGVGVPNARVSQAYIEVLWYPAPPVVTAAPIVPAPIVAAAVAGVSSLAGRVKTPAPSVAMSAFVHAFGVVKATVGAPRVSASLSAYSSGVVGSVADFIARLRRLLPRGWFPAVAPKLEAVLQGPALAFSLIYGMLAFARAQMRISTAQGGFLDLAAQDYFGKGGLPRLEYEKDPAYQTRIKYNLTAPRGTRVGMAEMLDQLTGQEPIIWQPNRMSDCGAWGSLANPNAGGGTMYWRSEADVSSPFSFGVGSAGAWGSLLLPAQAFIVVRPPITGLQVFGSLAGWGSQANPTAGGGYGWGTLASPGAGGLSAAWVDPNEIPGLVGDGVIYDQIFNWMPVAYSGWAMISDMEFA